MNDEVKKTFSGAQPPMRVIATNCATVNVEVKIVIAQLPKVGLKEIEKVDFKELFRDVVVTSY